MILMNRYQTIVSDAFSDQILSSEEKEEDIFRAMLWSIIVS